MDNGLIVPYRCWTVTSDRGDPGGTSRRRMEEPVPQCSLLSQENPRQREVRLGGTCGYGQREGGRTGPARKASAPGTRAPVPQTDTGRLGELSSGARENPR